MPGAYSAPSALYILIHFTVSFHRWEKEGTERPRNLPKHTADQPRAGSQPRRCPRGHTVHTSALREKNAGGRLLSTPAQGCLQVPLLVPERSQAPRLSPAGSSRAAAAFTSFLIFLTRADATAADKQPVGVNRKQIQPLVCLVRRWNWTGRQLSFRRAQGSRGGGRGRKAPSRRGGGAAAGRGPRCQETHTTSPASRGSLLPPSLSPFLFSLPSLFSLSLPPSLPSRPGEQPHLPSCTGGGRSHCPSPRG